MNETCRYLVAKYISDLHRMEPRNVGVIVWAAGCVHARFLGEKAPGEVDGRSIPAFVTNMGAYKQWIDFWRQQLSGNPSASGKRLQRCVDALKESSHGNFCVVDGGMILGKAEGYDPIELADSLFQRIVEPPLAEDASDSDLDQVADETIRQLRLTQNAHFHSRYQVACAVAPNVTENFEFSHAYKNGVLKRLYQRVPLAGKRTPLRRVVHDSAWMLEKVVRQGIVAHDQAIALVYANEQQRQDAAISWSFGVLSSVARLVNLAHPEECIAAFALE